MADDTDDDTPTTDAASGGAPEKKSGSMADFDLQELGEGAGEEDYLDARAAELMAPTGARDLEAVYEIPVQVAAVLGKASMQVSQLLKLGRGAVVELDRKVGEAIDIYVNNRLVARGEVVLVDDKLGVTMTEIIKSDKSPN
ncbi:MAG TPA: flagellar motor switch protein FliN [Rhodospirillaceae bacterium]|jgi:flagellar motor switch protein FliN|nr:flagellar motor switch protein FliN [Rhodospirillaceae bacterium]MAX61069.1 flagellar motor switch protein FliN [Rhodospirillaceae bacterium]MBB55810.1 flagellar motor switch protein FliN [Rhodospirillaceae bacterium]HAE01944.1 flagellar motor switch protein FliN [Rhodospirillaceae bacterium]HAJ21252.1 flagellar motor switch protein FliN [Rhodospirillaceae bacterium]|tara:strand:+ start:133545 stop:133967 length:423 start_codon:yes stop_codon:yes gene_type:complete